MKPLLMELPVVRPGALCVLAENLRFGTTVFPNPRLCKAPLDRITDRAHIIETGPDSFRFKRMLAKRPKR